MARPIDEKIVALKLDNSDLQRKASESVGMFAKLQKAFSNVKGFNLSGASEALADLSSEVGGFTMSPMEKAVDALSNRFGTFGVMAMTTIQNLTNKVVDFGTNMVHSLTSKPIMGGFREYELKMGATQTILASTGEELSVVNGYLEDLNEYSDRTIYSFADMTENIGKFTNSGVKLGDATKAIMGVSNVAALSGANTEKASRAMYNFSQALAQGHVKLIDWRSIENADMATVEFKNHLLESAVAAGTLEKTADGMYRVLTTDGSGSSMDETINATKNFNDSLTYQWMTTETLVDTLSDYADETTDIGKKAFRAAQEIKTFSQMTETLVETVESGWGKTFELIFGDYYTAIELWTGLEQVISGFLNAKSDRRNALVEQIIDLGGRESVINTLSNALKILLNIIEPVQKAWKALFPPGDTKATIITGVIKGLEKLTEVLVWISSGVGVVVGDVFKVIFGVLRAGIDVLKSVGRFFVNLIPKDLPGSLSKVADFLKSIRDTAKEMYVAVVTSEEFQAMLTLVNEKLKEFSKWARDSIIKLYQDMNKWLDELIKKMPGFINSTIETAKELSKWISKFISTASDAIVGFVSGAGNMFVNIWGDIRTVFGNLKTTISEFKTETKKAGSSFKDNFGGVIEFIGGLFEGLGNILDRIDFSQLIKGGIITTFLIYGKKIIDMIKELREYLMPGDEDKEPFWKSLLNNVTDAFKDMTNSIKIGSIVAIAGSITAIAIALKILEDIDHEDLSKGLATLGIALAGMVKGMKAISGLDMNAKQAITTAGLILTMSTAVVILAAAMKVVESIDSDKFLQSITGLVVIMGSLVGSLHVMSKSNDKIAVTAGFILALSVSVRIMAGAVKSLSNIEELTKGLVGLGVMLLEIGIFAKIIDQVKIGVGTGVALLVIAGAIKVMASAVEDIGSIDVEQMKQGLIGLGILLLEIGLFSKMVDGAKMAGTAIGILALSIAIERFVPPIEQLGSMPWETLALGLAGMGAALMAIGGSMRLAGGAAAGVGMLAVAVALELLVPQIILLGSTDLATLGIGLAALAVGFGIIGGTAALLSGASVSLLAFGAGLLMVGASVALVGIGLLAFATGLTALAGITATSIAAIVLALGTLLKKGLELIPQITGFILAILESIIGGIAESLPRLLESAVSIVFTLLEGIRDNIYRLATVAAEIIVEFAKAIGDNVPELVKAAVELIIKFVDGLANTIREEGPRFVKAVLGLVESILEVIILALTDVIRILFGWIPGVEKAMDKAGEGATDALREAFKIEDVATDKTDDFIDNVRGGGGRSNDAGKHIATETKSGMVNVNGFDKVGAIHATDYTTGIANQTNTAKKTGSNFTKSASDGMAGTKFKPIGTEDGQEYISGLDSQKSPARNSGVQLVNSTREGALSGSLESAGAQLGGGFSRGISSMASDVREKASALANAARWAVQEAVRIQSPSKDLEEDGMDFGRGLANGISAMRKHVASKAKEIIIGAEETIQSYSGYISEALDGSMDMSPVITPVIDMSDIDKANTKIIKLNDLRIKQNLQEEAIHTITAINQPKTDDTNVKEIRQLNKTIDNLSRKVDSISDRAIVVENSVDGKVFSKAVAKPMRKAMDDEDLHRRIIMTGGDR